MPTIQTFNWHPDASWQVDTEPKVHVAQFGDGYSQRTRDGINSMMEVWDLKFTGGVALLESINQFLRDRGGADAFLWVTPEEKTIYVTCAGWQRSREKGVLVSISAKFQQVPSP